MAHDHQEALGDCDAFVYVNDVTTCDVSAFEKQLNSISEPG